MEGLESKNNVQQNLNIDLNKPEKSEVFSKVPVSIAVTGTFSNLMNYLANLESLSYFISIASLSFGNANSGGTISRPGEIDRNEINRNTDMTMSLNGYSYWR
ncbi:MAG: type 4a pilus biogenesis protein PilO [Candidatus Falkowbacteria bacterium]|nr:type 4a pilus biogenesis protein PilO [Candidatus Falkowbacteria bacterium]